jgi:hypothetical protein
LALTGPGSAAAADEGTPGAGTDATGTSSKQVGPADAWLNRDALDLNLYGLAYHPDREAADRRHMENQVNPGFAVHYELAKNLRGITFAEVGIYEDSGRNWAKLAALGYQFKFGERWGIGGALAVIDSRSYNHGAAFLSVVPLITYDVGRIKLNAVYFPKFGHYNQFAAFGFYIGIPLRNRAGQSVPER